MSSAQFIGEKRTTINVIFIEIRGKSLIVRFETGFNIKKEVFIRRDEVFGSKKVYTYVA